MPDGDSGKLSFACTVGHAVDGDKLDELTVVQTLDTGAEVRLCREHGAPIAMTAHDTAHAEPSRSVNARPPEP